MEKSTSNTHSAAANSYHLTATSIHMNTNIHGTRSDSITSNVHTAVTPMATTLFNRSTAVVSQGPSVVKTAGNNITIAAATAGSSQTEMLSSKTTTSVTKSAQVMNASTNHHDRSTSTILESTSATTSVSVKPTTATPSSTALDTLADSRVSFLTSETTRPLGTLNRDEPVSSNSPRTEFAASTERKQFNSSTLKSEPIAQPLLNSLPLESAQRTSNCTVAVVTSIVTPKSSSTADNPTPSSSENISVLSTSVATSSNNSITMTALQPGSTISVTSVNLTTASTSISAPANIGMPPSRYPNSASTFSTEAVGARSSTLTSTSAKTRVLVHPICVGQGDAILLEVHHKSGKTEKHLIDGGRGQRSQNSPYYKHLKEALKDHHCIEKPATSRVAGSTLVDRSYSHIKLDSITITHPDQDHYEGINRLMEEFTVTCPIVTTTATYIYTEHTRPGVTSHRSGETFRPCPTNLTQHWFPVTNGGKQHGYIKTLPKGTRVKITKNPSYKGDINKSSVLTTVSLPGSEYDYDVILTGDSYGYTIQTILQLEGKSVGVFQVPHHGSRSNYSTTQSTIAQCTQFYSSFRADVYLICHGAHKGFNHPHKEVITGILTAAVEKRHHCKIVVTATRFDGCKIALTEYKDIRNWRDHVKIYHFKEGTPYVTLDPSVGQIPEGLQLFNKQAQTIRIQENKLREKKLTVRQVSRNGNCFFNAISGALQQKYSRTITQMQLREKTVAYLLKLKDIYYPQSGLRTMEEYCQKANEYLRDGHSSPSFKRIIPDAVAGALAIRIQVISTDIAQEDQFFGPDHDSRLRIQLVQDASFHYDYTMPAAGCGNTTYKSDNQLSASIQAEIPPPQHTPTKLPVSRPVEVPPSQHTSMNLPVDRPVEEPQAQHTPVNLRVDRPAEIPSTQHTPTKLPVNRPIEVPPAQHTPVNLPVNWPAETADHTPIEVPSHLVQNSSGLTCRRQLQFSPPNVVDNDTQQENRECCICKLIIKPNDQLFHCRNTKCLVLTHYDCEYKSRENRRFVQDFKKCEHCRTCKECNEVMGRANVMCKVCVSYAHIACVRRVPGQIAGDYTCKKCRVRLGTSTAPQRTISTHIHLNTGNIIKKQECCICKQEIQPTDCLFNCKNSKCTVSTHYECEYKSRERRRFVRDFGKCEHCRTCKECNTVMGRANEMCKECVGYAHVACVRRAPGQIEGDYVCKECRV